MTIAIAAGLMTAVWFGVPAAQGKNKKLPGVDSSNYYPFTQIDKSNVARLAVRIQGLDDGKGNTIESIKFALIPVVGDGDSDN